MLPLRSKYAPLDETTVHADAESAGTTARAPFSPRSSASRGEREGCETVSTSVLDGGKHRDSTVLRYVVIDSYVENAASVVCLPPLKLGGPEGFGAPSRHSEYSGRVKTKSHLLFREAGALLSTRLW